MRLQSVEAGFWRIINLKPSFEIDTALYCACDDTHSVGVIMWCKREYYWNNNVKCSKACMILEENWYRNEAQTEVVVWIHLQPARLANCSYTDQFSMQCSLDTKCYVVTNRFTRCYAIVQRAVSRSPFKLTVSICSNDLTRIDWETTVDITFCLTNSLVARP